MQKAFCVMVLTILSSVPIVAQTSGVSWNGPGPSVNVKAFGAFGDLQSKIDGTVNSANSNQLSSLSATFTPADVGKHLWIDQSRYPAPVLVGIAVKTTGTGCMGTPGFGNTGSYAFHVYYRITLTSGTGGTFLEGDPSVEGFTSIPAGSSAQCVRITPPTTTTSASNYSVYFSSDAPPLWVMGGNYNSLSGPHVLDPNGNVELLTSGSGVSNPPTGFNKTVGATTNDINSLVWLNLGPVVPGSGSGAEIFQSAATQCTSGNPPLTGPTSTCEIDNVQTVTAAPPPAVHLFDAGTITAMNSSTSVTFSNPLPLSFGPNIANATFAWGHDDTIPITNALGSLTTLNRRHVIFPHQLGVLSD